jgi:hypothetical protein
MAVIHRIIQEICGWKGIAGNEAGEGVGHERSACMARQWRRGYLKPDVVRGDPAKVTELRLDPGHAARIAHSPGRARVPW